mmetsp:Transcript_73432/g.192558  ORF Transcript_73432/g.192558 Transcript_73432/m.192558 type:complete len:548 (+) Transcript_73432:154-1797(+)
MVEVKEQPVWYRIYVLFILLIVCVCSLATRNLPSYLVTVPVPDCEEICRDVSTQPVCGSVAGARFPEGEVGRHQACQLCRVRALPAENATSPVTPASLVAGPKRRPRQSLLAADRSSGLGDAPERLSQGPLSQFGYDGIPWQGRARKDAAYYNMADGTCLHYWEYGLLIGVCFALVFAAGSVPAGYVCDHKSRVLVASASLFVWSVATALQASAHSIWFLLACRAALALSQAFAMPAAISLTADYFTSRQNFAVAILSVGLHLGSGCASFSILFAEAVGWRWAVLIAGLFGMALTPVLYCTVREPERTEWSAPCSVAIVSEEVLQKSRVARMLIWAGSAKMIAAYSLSAFLPIWYSRRGLIGYTSYSYACWNALIISSGGLLSAVFGSVAGGLWGRRDICAPCWLGMFGALLSIPLVCMVLQTPHFNVSMLCLFLLILVSECWCGPTLTLLQASVRRSVQGQAVSLFLVLTTLAGTLGPAIVGFIDPGTERVGAHLLWIAVAANIVAAAMFYAVAREIQVDPVAAGVGSKPGEDPPGSGRRISWTAF